MTLYVCSYAVPFPRSEYGGIVGIVAESDEDAEKIYLKWIDPYDIKDYPEIPSKITDAVKKAERFNNVGGKARVAFSFIT